MAQGHRDPLVAMRVDEVGMPSETAEVEIQALVSGPFSNSRIVSTVRLACTQDADTISIAQEKATDLAMEGLRNGWEVLQQRIAQGHFPGCAQ